MKDKIIKIEKIIFYSFLALISLTVLSLLLKGFITDFFYLKFGFEYSFYELFSGGMIRTSLITTIIVLVLAFIVFWIWYQAKLKRLSYGPIYIICFALLFVYANGYYSGLYHPDFPFVIMMISASFSFVACIFCAVTYVLTIGSSKNDAIDKEE